MEPTAKDARELGGLVQLHQVPRRFQDVEPCAGNQLGEPLAAVDRDPGVVASPDDEDGQVERRVERLDLRGVGLIGLGDLAVERGLAGLAEPWTSS
jgi:hypothetical protein